ncbi:hypothetical protein E6B08_19510 [Pseudomonas putida]|uniref:Uncharacterized protein n=1 Tax=Pseudomonas putida TaxID=303 RepID=A0A4D6XCF2_PSEPU|nr:hypothetical protein E6B08_19510 [Pseudomonas putida]
MARAALRPIRGTSPLPQVQCSPQRQRSTCGSGLVPRMGCRAALGNLDGTKKPGTWPGFFMAGA